VEDNQVSFRALYSSADSSR